MGNICSDDRDSSPSEWDEVIYGCIESAGMLVVGAFNRIKKEYRPSSHDTRTNVAMNLKKVPDMYKEDLIPLIRQHEQEWKRFTKKHIAELIALSEDMNHWRRAQVFRGTRIVFAAQAKVARIIAPVLLSNFASKTGQPLGFAPSLMQLLNPLITHHFDMCKQCSSDLAAPLFIEVDKDDDDIIVKTEVQLHFFSKLFELSSDITFIEQFASETVDQNSNPLPLPASSPLANRILQSRRGSSGAGGSGNLSEAFARANSNIPASSGAL